MTSTTTTAVGAATGTTTFTTTTSSSIDEVLQLIDDDYDDDDEYEYSYCEDDNDDDNEEEDNDDTNDDDMEEVINDINNVNVSSKKDRKSKGNNDPKSVTEVNNNKRNNTKDDDTTTSASAIATSSSVKVNVVVDDDDEVICPLCFESMLIDRKKRFYYHNYYPLNSTTTTTMSSLITTTTNAATTTTTSNAAAAASNTNKKKTSIQLVPCQHYVCIECWKEKLNTIGYYEACGGGTKLSSSSSTTTTTKSASTIHTHTHTTTHESHHHNNNHTTTTTNNLRCPACEEVLDKKHLAKTFAHLQLVPTLFDMVRLPDKSILKLVISYLDDPLPIVRLAGTCKALRQEILALCETIVNDYRNTERRSLPSSGPSTRNDMELFIRDSSARLYAEKIESQFQSKHNGRRRRRSGGGDHNINIVQDNMRAHPINQINPQQLQQQQWQFQQQLQQPLAQARHQQRREPLDHPPLASPGVESKCFTIPNLSCGPIRNPKYFDFFVRISIDDDTSPSCWQGYAKVIHDDTTMKLRLDITDVIGPLHDNMSLPFVYAHDTAASTTTTATARQPDRLQSRLQYGTGLEAMYTVLAFRKDRVRKPMLVLVTSGPVVAKPRDRRFRVRNGRQESEASSALRRKLRNTIGLATKAVRSDGGKAQKSDLYGAIGGSVILPNLEDENAQSSNGVSDDIQCSAPANHSFGDGIVELALNGASRLDCDCDGTCCGFCPSWRAKQDQLEREIFHSKATE